MKKRCMGILLCLTLLSTILVSCENSQKEEHVVPSEEKDDIRIGLIFDTFVLERWTTDRDVFVSVAQKLGARVDVLNANGDSAKQRQQLQRCIDQQMDVIVVVAVDCFKLTDLITTARNKGINVISYDRLIQGVATDLYVTVDNELVGQEMADTMKQRLPEGGNIIMICGPESDTNSLDVVKGFEATIKDSNLTVVSKTHVKSWTPEYGFQAVNEAFKDVDQIDGVMCGNDGLAGYAIKALSEQQLAGQVVVVGQDADLEACQRVMEGTQTMTVYKPIKELAAVAAESAVKLAEGDVVERTSVRETDDGYRVPYLELTPIAVTTENMDEVIVEPGFHLRDEVYLNVDSQD